jgi:hypothetical protein
MDSDRADPRDGDCGNGDAYLLRISGYANVAPPLTRLGIERTNLSIGA